MSDPTERADEPIALKSADVVQFPHVSEEERVRRVMAEVTRLASLAPGEWRLWHERSAERLGIEPNKLAELIQAQIEAREQTERKTQAEARLMEDRAKRLRLVERDRQRGDDAKSRAETAAALKAEKVAAMEAARQQKEAERKTKERQKSFNNLLKLLVDRHAGELKKLAKRLGEDAEALQQEFKEFAGVADGFSAVSDDDVEPWTEPVDVGELLQGIDVKLGKHVVLQQHQRMAVTLWTAMAWVHNDIAVHSPILTATSAEIGSGKTELLNVVARLVPRPSINVEMTGPSLFRFVDAQKPTLIIDEADDLFVRKSDLKHIINASWTRGTKIPRQVKIDGVFVTVFFDPFCPKALGLLGKNLPRALKSRGIEIRMVPKRADETVQPFEHTDDFEFAVLRRQLARFAADNAKTLKDTQPAFPPGMNNRVQMNWKLLLAIAELAGGLWLQQAREAAERLTRSGRQPSDGVHLLAAFADSGKIEITSEDVVTEFCRNPLDIWATYNRGSKITQRQVAILLDAYDIHPISLHPTKRKNLSRQGYKLSQFTDAFARYLPEHPIIQSSLAVAKRRSAKPKKRKAARRG
jgi:Protein of unknown function (DUF3631)